MAGLSDVQEISVGPGSLFTDEMPRLRATAWMILGSREAAEDVVQDSFVRFLRVGSDDVAEPAAYLRVIVLNECRRQSRRSRRDVLLTEDVEPATFDHSDLEMLDALHVLSPKRRMVVVLRYFEQLEVKEIARLLNCRPSTVSSLIHRALSQLQGVMSDADR